MTTETYTDQVAILVQGTGPYAYANAYSRADDIVVSVRPSAAELIILPGADWSITPASSDTGGNITLSSSAAATYDGADLTVDRDTLVEQGWAGTGGAREEGLEVQLDRHARALQDTQRTNKRTIQMPVDYDGAIPQFPLPDAGKVPQWGTNGTIINGPAATDIAEARPNAELALQYRNEAEQFRDEALTNTVSNDTDLSNDPEQLAPRSVMAENLHRTGVAPKLPNIADVEGTGDLNEAIEGGFYSLSGSYTNGPAGAASAQITGTMQVIRRAFSSGPRVTQFIYLGNSELTVRARVGTGNPVAWGDWEQVFPPAEDLSPTDTVIDLTGLSDYWFTAFDATNDSHYDFEIEGASGVSSASFLVRFSSDGGASDLVDGSYEHNKVTAVTEASGWTFDVGAGNENWAADIALPNGTGTLSGKLTLYSASEAKPTALIGKMITVTTAGATITEVQAVATVNTIVNGVQFIASSPGTTFASGSLRVTRHRRTAS